MDSAKHDAPEDEGAMKTPTAGPGASRAATDFNDEPAGGDAITALTGKSIKDSFVSPDLKDTLTSALATGIFRPDNRDPSTIATGPDSALFGPDITDEWHAVDVLTAKLGLGQLTAEDRRVGTVGRSVGKSTIAYWVGNVIANLAARPGIAAGKVRLRGTFVFEKRAGSWVVVQADISQPIEDPDLAADVFGTALVSLNPLAITCDDGSRQAMQPFQPAQPTRATPEDPTAPPSPDRRPSGTGSPQSP